MLLADRSLILAVTVLLAQTWLILRNDFRLLWRDFRAGKLHAFSSGVFLGIVFVLVQAVTILMFIGLRRPPPLGIEAFAWFFIGFVMLGAGMNTAVTVLFERADFDLLLSAPISPRAILLARLCAMTAAAALAVAFFFVPMLNGAIIGLSPRYLYGYLTWLFVATATTSVGVWLTLLLVRWLGARRARTWAQVIAALLGATIYIVFQLHNALPPEVRGAMASSTARLFANPAFTVIARAGRGELLPLLVLFATAGAFTMVTTHLLGRIFVTGIQEAGVVKVRPQRHRRYRFTDGLMRATIRKDVRLIVRDPLLLSRVLPSVFYLVPVLFPLHRIGHVGATGLIAPFAVIAAVTLSSQLTAVAASGEEGWDLIRLSPASTVTLRLAKIAAGLALPGAVALVLSVIVSLLGRPGVGLLTLITSLICGAGSCWLEVASMRPTPRKDLIQPNTRTRRPLSAARVLSALAFLGVGTGTVVLAVHEMWWLSFAAFGMVALAVIACFTLVEMKDIEFEGAVVAPRRHEH